MQKSSFWSVLLFLLALGGVLFAIYSYIQRKREEEAYWDEFEEYDDDDYLSDEDECGCEYCQPQPTPEPQAEITIDVDLPDEEIPTEEN